MSTPRAVIRWTNSDMVMTFGQDGQQIPELQGPYEEVREAVLAAAGEHTRFQHGSTWGQAPEDVSREEW
jgi:hypothetical protein